MALFLAALVRYAPEGCNNNMLYCLQWRVTWQSLSEEAVLICYLSRRLAVRRGPIFPVDLYEK